MTERTQGIRGLSLARAVLAVVLVVGAVSAFAQLQTGNIYGRATDEQGVGLPGVSVTLTGVGAPVTTVTNAQGDYRFLNLSPGSYSISHALSGFSTLKRDGVNVSIGQNTELTVALKLSGVTAEMVVTGESPLLDTRRTTTGANVTQAELTSIPTGRDPWVILQSVPGVLVDRVNVGGSESGQQSGYTAKGSSPSSGTWNVDGVNITDVGAVGSSPTYYDFDSFQEMQVATGGNDVTLITAGANLNMVTKRGTNDVHGSGRIFITDNRWEARGNNQEAINQGFTVTHGSNTVSSIQDYGLEVGGPVIKDRLWLWGSYGRNQINLLTISNSPDRTTLEDINAKLNAQIVDNNSATVFFLRGDKIKIGRNASVSRPPETTWDQSGPTMLYKLEDSHIFSPNLFATALVSYIDGGFGLHPEGGCCGTPGATAGAGTGAPYVYRDSVNTWHRSYLDYSSSRPQAQVSGSANAFMRTGEIGHEFKFGFTYRTAPVGSFSRWPHDTYTRDRANNVNRVYITRETNFRYDSTFYQGYLSDTLTMKNLTVNLGVRYDQQQGHNRATTAEANQDFPEILPAISQAEAQPTFKWKNFSPRIGLTYALGTDTSKTLIRASYGRFVDNLGGGPIFWNNNAQYGYLRYRWTDANGDHIAQKSEVNFHSGPASQCGAVAFYNLDPCNPGAAFNPNVVDPDLKSPTTDEFVLGAEKEVVPGLAVSVNGTYRKYKNFNWTPNFGLNADGSLHVYGPSDWLPYTTANFPDDPNGCFGGACDGNGNLTGTDQLGRPYSVPIYELNPNAPAPTGGRYFTNMPDYSQEYKGVELQINKRYSHNWSMRASATYNNWTQNGAQASVWGDLTPQLNSTVFFSNQGVTNDGGGQVFTSVGGGSGAKGFVYINSKWQGNLNALYSLPLGFSVAGNFFVRQGYPFVMYTSDFTTFNGGRQIVINKPTEDRLPTVSDLDLRVAKDIKIASLGVTLSIDIFNVLNRNSTLQRNADIGATKNLNGGDIYETQAPRVVRFGGRLSF